MKYSSSIFIAMLFVVGGESIYASNDDLKKICADVVAGIGGKASTGLVDKAMAKLKPGNALAKIFPLPTDDLPGLRTSLQNLISLPLSDQGRLQALSLLKESLVRLPPDATQTDVRDLISKTAVALASKGDESDRVALRSEAEMGLLGPISGDVNTYIARLPMPAAARPSEPSESRGLVNVKLGASQIPMVWDPNNSRAELSRSKEGSPEWTRKAQTGLLMATEIFGRILNTYKRPTASASEKAAIVESVPQRYSEFSFEAERAMRIISDVASHMGGALRFNRVAQLHGTGRRYAQMITGYKMFDDPAKIKVAVKEQWKWLQNQGFQISSASMVQVSGYMTRFEGENAYEVINLERKAALMALIRLLLIPESHRIDLGHNYWESASLALRSLLEPQDIETVVPLLLLYNSLNASRASSVYDVTESIPLIIRDFFGIKMKEGEDRITKSKILEPEDEEIRAALAESMDSALEPYRAVGIYRLQQHEEREQKGSRL